MKKILILTVLALGAFSCTQSTGSTLVASKQDCNTYITGAVCNDGTTSTSTGSGTCSGHGGVKAWKCKN